MIDVDVVWSVRLQYALELNYVKTNGYTMDVERGGGQFIANMWMCE